MDERQQKLTDAFLYNNQGQISDKTFLEQYPQGEQSLSELISTILSDAAVQCISGTSAESERVEAALNLGFHFGFSTADKNTLIRLLDNPLHTRHEDVIWALESLKLGKDDDLTEAFYRCALSEFDYLEYERGEDGSYMLNSNSIYGLAKIATPLAIEKLSLLSQSEIILIRLKVGEVAKIYNLTL